MSLNEAMYQLEMAQKEISKLQEELEMAKKENEAFKQNEFINSLKMSSNRHGW